MGIIPSSGVFSNSIRGWSLTIGKWVKKWSVPRSDGVGVWVVSLSDCQVWGCSCPVWKFHRQECKHILLIKNTPAAQQAGKIEYRPASPGNVGEVSIKGSVVLYPLVPFGSGPDLPATIIFDLIRAQVQPDEVSDYKRKFFRDTALRDIIAHVKIHGRFVYTEFQKDQGWVKPQLVSCDLPVKTI